MPHSHTNRNTHINTQKSHTWPHSFFGVEIGLRVDDEDLSTVPSLRVTCATAAYFEPAMKKKGATLSLFRGEKGHYSKVKTTASDHQITKELILQKNTS